MSGIVGKNLGRGSGVVKATPVADESVDSDAYVNASIDNAHLADDAVDSDELAAGAVDLAHMSAESVDSDQYVDGSIDNAHIADNAIDSEHYAAGSIDGEHLAVGKDGALSLDATPGTDHTANGPQTSTLNAGYGSAIGELVYLHTDGEWYKTDADAASSSISLLGIALEAKTDGQAMNVALSGSFVRDDTYNFNVGVPLYIHTTTGEITHTKPSGSGDIVRTVGYAITADIIFFNPSSDYVTLA